MKYYSLPLIFLIAGTLYAGPIVAADATGGMTLPEVHGQFVRIELPGDNRVLSLAEVSVFEKQINVALNKKTTQSTVAFSGNPARAVDGNPDGTYLNASVSHTELNGTDPWWEVDLGRTAKMEQIVVHNRTDRQGERLDGFTLKILDAERKQVYSQEDVPQSAFISFLQAGVKPVEVQQPNQGDIDYALNAAPKVRKGYAVLPIDPAGINVVAGNLGNYQSDFKDRFANHMNLWMSAKQPGLSRITWDLQVPSDGVYEVDALAAKGGDLSLTCNGEKQGSATVGRSWSRVSLGSIRMKAGKNTLQLDVEAGKGFEFDALELVQPTIKAEMLKEALTMRTRADWFADAGYGLMFQWTNRATPPKGPIKPWEQKVNDFDLEAYADMVEESGAAYVLWSVTWGQQYISAPIGALDAIIAGRTTKRDLLGEMVDALDKRGIKLIFYYHYGYDCNHSIDADWMKASGGYKADKTKFYENWKAVVTEMGDRYGDKLHGWWFDGGQRYYNCHFDNTPGDQGILTAPFKELTEAAKSGNPKRVIAYNSWIKPRLSEYQDYYGGEGAHVASGLKQGVFQSGPQQGLMAHGCFIFEKNWGHIGLNSTIPKPRHTLEKLTAMIERAQEEHFPLSINLEMYEDGSVSPDSTALLERLRDVVRKK